MRKRTSGECEERTKRRTSASEELKIRRSGSKEIRIRGSKSEKIEIGRSGSEEIKIEGSESEELKIRRAESEGSKEFSVKLVAFVQRSQKMTKYLLIKTLMLAFEPLLDNSRVSNMRKNGEI